MLYIYLHEEQKGSNRREDEEDGLWCLLVKREKEWGRRRWWDLDERRWKGVNGFKVLRVAVVVSINGILAALSTASSFFLLPLESLTKLVSKEKEEHCLIFAFKFHLFYNYELNVIFCYPNLSLYFVYVTKYMESKIHK